MNSLVSIVVPCYKQAHYLDQCLQSVLEQTYNYWECIIVNDGSPDHTKTIAHQWVKKDARFRYLEQENGGLSSARNAGIFMSEGSLILPLDADDVLHPDYLSRLVPVLVENNNLSIVSCYTAFFIQSVDKSYFQLKPKGSELINLLYQNQLVSTSLYRKSSWEKVGGYDEQMKTGFEDWEFWLRVLKTEGLAYHIFPEVLFFYRKSKKSMLVDTVTNHLESVKKYIIQKHPEIYKADFRNFISVQFHYLQTARAKENALKNSAEYKLGRLLLKPFKFLFSPDRRNKFTK